MRFYRTDTGQWFNTQQEAKAAARAANTRWGPVDVPTDKPGLLAWLADQAAPSPETLLGPQGDIAVAIGAEPAASNTAFVPEQNPVRPEEGPQDLSRRTVDLDAAFAAAPLAQRLTLAAIALEDARALVPVSAHPEQRSSPSTSLGINFRQPAEVESAPVEGRPL